jgi:hypothetical protein
LKNRKLRGDGNAQRVAGEKKVGVPLRCRGASRAAFLARPIDLDDALRRGEIPRRSHFFDDPLDVGAEELEGPVAGLADEMKMTRVTVRMLEPESPFAEIDLAGDAGVHHPLEGPVDGGPADTMILAPDQVHEVVGAQMPFLLDEDIDDLLPLAGALTARWLQACDVRKGRRHAR